jgi:hypothetical protein
MKAITFTLPTITFFLASSFFLGCQNSKPKSEGLTVADNSQSPPINTTNPKTFNGSMKELQDVLIRLLPKVVDVNQYNAPENKKPIDDDVKRLLVLSKNVSHSPSVALKDPSVNFISKAFSEDLEKIDESLASGKRDFARYNLMNMTAYCIECHTRTSTGPSFRSPALEETLKKLNGLERGEFLVATRQFDAALRELSDFIDQRLSQKNDFFSLDKAVRYALSVTVKYLKSPEKSLAIVEKIKKASGVPYYLKQNSLGWELAIKDWMKENPPKDNSTASMLKRSREWVIKAQQMQVGMVDRGGDIYFLRALSDLHLILAAKLTPEQMGEALYLTGLSYEAVQDLSTYNLHENYYETCIRKVPHTVWSQKCFKRYEEAVYFGYTGSSGVRLPEDEAKRLNDLRALALMPGQEE